MARGECPFEPNALHSYAAVQPWSHVHDQTPAIKFFEALMFKYSFVFLRSHSSCIPGHQGTCVDHVVDVDQRNLQVCRGSLFSESELQTSEVCLSALTAPEIVSKLKREIWKVPLFQNCQFVGMTGGSFSYPT